MILHLRGDKTKSLKTTTDDADRIVRLSDDVDFTYATITYDDNGNITTYEDYKGNWYDCKIFKCPSPFDHETVGEKEPSIFDDVWMYDWIAREPMRIYHNAPLISLELVATTPMEQPVSVFSYMDMQYPDYTHSVVEKNWYQRFICAVDPFNWSSNDSR